MDYLGEKADVESMDGLVGLGAGIHIVAHGENQFEHFLESARVSDVIAGRANLDECL